MKKKFEDNVAVTTLRDKTGEPSLPWKVDETDLAGIETREGGYEALSAEAAPLKTRPIFLVLLVVTIFFAALYMVAVMAGENEFVKLGISTKEKEVAELQVSIDKVSAEKEALKKSSDQLEKRIGDLSSQKELFTAVLESLTKRNDAPEIAVEPSGVSVVEQKKESIEEPAVEIVSASGESVANFQ